MRTIRGTRALWAALTTVTLLAVGGCGSDDKTDGTAGGGSPSPTTSTSPTPATPPSLAVTPRSGATKLPVSTEIGIQLANGSVSSVTVSDKNGRPVAGAMRDDGSAWVPAKPLAYGTAYTATVTAGGAGPAVTQTTSFTTMKKPGRTIGSGLYLFDDKTYGVAMPVVAEFTPGIPAKDRAAVQKRMFVKTDPPQPGAWHWVANGTQAYYRAPEYWQPGTTLTVRLGLEGIPLSNGRYGNTDRAATAKIGDRFEMKVDNATKQMTVLVNGQVARTIPVSLGKKSTPSSSGTMVVMEKKENTTFDTRDAPDPANRYVIDIDLAQRLTWGGEYIHAAPWSVGSQGRRNVSHGCVNMSTNDARWLFGKTKIGDPITVIGTERKLEPGNGWTAWNMSWSEFVKGSALPVPPGLG
ncbi:Ig-like domain-containing protein [Plantactinospora sp. GCM10030261]|uniref:L,D-transpeptidase n=1 Tax=Plantactinospora sp. GCM10030261 TaxID=3273420 RepID=UPI003608388E